MSAFTNLMDRALMRYPHFEDENGQKDIMAAQKEYAEILEAFSHLYIEAKYTAHNNPKLAEAILRAKSVLSSVVETTL